MCDPFRAGDFYDLRRTNDRWTNKGSIPPDPKSPRAHDAVCQFSRSSAFKPDRMKFPCHLRTVFLLLLICFITVLCPSQVATTGWPTYGGDAGGQRFSGADQITPTNVTHLMPVWTYHTRALSSTNHSVRFSDFEATPILLGSTLYLATPFDRVIALDVATGAERWTYDPRLQITSRPRTSPPVVWLPRYLPPHHREIRVSSASSSVRWTPAS